MVKYVSQLLWHAKCIYPISWLKTHGVDSGKLYTCASHLPWHRILSSKHHQVFNQEDIDGYRYRCDMQLS